MDHHFDRYASQAAAFKEEGGSYDKETVDKIVAWIRERTRR